MTQPHHRAKFVLSTLLGGILLVSCSAAEVQQAGEQVGELEARVTTEAGDSPQAQAPNESQQTTESVPKSPPQLVKTAQLALTVESIDETLEAVSNIAKQQQGDILGLEDKKPQNSYSRPKASMQIRVPQANLEPTLDALAQLGTVESRNLSAEDVSNQLVDFQARLRNLRKQESLLLDIMERSGSVGDVLKVAQELNNIRQAIEQIDAQYKNLRNRVAYSTINLQLEAAVASSTAQPPLTSEVENAWKNATQSVGDFTTDLIRFGIWLAAYSPYLLVLAGIAWLSYNRFKKQPSPSPNQASDSHPAR
jgi:hypothetical protein